ncbi:MAG TPA: hypothetical protein VK463_07660 [Desulfomonilaceae bacterium]|nr:hypothetical protein [Desulfomonilaceae bacterium]
MKKTMVLAIVISVVAVAALVPLNAEAFLGPIWTPFSMGSASGCGVYGGGYGGYGSYGYSGCGGYGCGVSYSGRGRGFGPMYRGAGYGWGGTGFAMGFGY